MGESRRCVKVYLNESTSEKLDELLQKYQGDYYSASHVLRCGVHLLHQWKIKVCRGEDMYEYVKSGKAEKESAGDSGEHSNQHKESEETGEDESTGASGGVQIYSRSTTARD